MSQRSDETLTTVYPAPFPYGPPVLPRLLKHPAAAGGWLPSGDPVDAGTMHHLSSNLSLLCRESARHLVSDVGPGGLPRTGGTYTGDGWDAAYTDSGLTGSTSTDAISHAISWDRRTARSYHLPAMIADRELPEGGYGLRVIEVEVDCFVAAANSFRLYCALTSTYQTPDQGALALSTWSAWSTTNEQFSGANNGTPSALSATTGRQTVRMWIITNTPVGAPSAQWRCRDSGSVAAMSSLVNEGHLWVGWKSSNASNAIISINAWEVPPPFAPPIDTWHGGSTSGELLWWLRADANDVATAPGGTEVVEYFKNLASGYGGLVYVGSGLGGEAVTQNIVGGKPGLRIDAGAARWFESPTMPLVLGEFTVFAVLVLRSNNTTGYASVFGTRVFAPTPDGGGGIAASGGLWGAWAEDRATGFVGTSLTVDSPVILCARANATDVFLDKNGLQVGTIARPAPSGSVAQKAIIGSDNTYYTGDGVFDLCEVVAYNKHMSVDERAFVLEYLNRRYGVF